ncbi:MAG TPA: hypothetical protein VK171_09395 [Fimbriimonas sp.]|nr:hypothetical protein [Fimbriimonas sp.]
MSTKVIISNSAALSSKYGAPGLASVQSAISTLVAAGTAAGITTQVVYVDLLSGGKAVTNPSDQKQNKDAIDSILLQEFDYVVLLGGPDIIPHQDLTNPLPKDQDQSVPSDLPYACTAPYSTDISDFLKISRVVTRLPDVNGASDASDFVTLIEETASMVQTGVSTNGNVLGVSALVWQASTDLSMSNILGVPSTARSSPTNGPHWTPSELQSSLHFINCHGSPADPRFYGQSGSSYPVSHEAALVVGNLTPGMLAAAECCYGAELYDPFALGIHKPMSNSYLESGCAGYMGSTNIAYGPASGNGAADLICQYFAIEFRSGRSVGAAGFEARVAFIRGSKPMGPVDLKTIAQFLILGDASVALQPIPAPADTVVATAPVEVKSRRSTMRRSAAQVNRFTTYAKSPVESKVLVNEERPDAIEEAFVLISDMTFAVEGKTPLMKAKSADNYIKVQIWQDSTEPYSIRIQEVHVKGEVTSSRVVMSK